MANWRPVDVRVWNDRKFLACSDAARLLWLFLLTCPSLPIPGVIVGGDAALAELLGWTPERLRERFAELARNGLQVRREARIVWLPNALKYQPPANPNMVKSWGKKWDDVPEGELKVELWDAVRIACKSWTALFGKLFPEPSADGSRNRSANGSRNGSIHQHQHQHQHDHDPEEEDSLPPARDPAAPQPEPAPVPAVSPPAPAREDIAGTHGADRPAETETGQNRPVRTSNEAEKPAAPVGDRDVKPSNLAAQAFDPNDAFARGRLAEATWRRISDAALALAAELKLPAPIPFPAITPGSNRKGFVELRERIREEGELAPTVCDRVVENLVKQARSKRSIEWLAEKVFGENAWVNARNGVDPSARPTAPRRGDPPPPAPARKRPDPEPRTPSRSAAELAELAAMTDRLVANPDAAAAAELELGRVPTHLPTAELMKRFGDGKRAPPTSIFPDDDTPPDENLRRKAAK